MTSNPEASAVSDASIAEVLTGMANAARAEAAVTPGYKMLADSKHLTSMLSALDHQMTTPILNAMEVLKSQHGFTGNEATYRYLFEVPVRSKNYRAHYASETHVGCYDRTVTRLAEELLDADQGRNPEHEPMPRAASVALLAHIDERTATDLLITATHADDAQRIQRLSTDRWEIARRMAEDTGLSAGKLAETVRQVLYVAAQIVTEQDREVPLEDQEANRG